MISEGKVRQAQDRIEFQRRVLRSTVDGLSLSEIATRLGCSEQRVWWWQRALGLLEKGRGRIGSRRSYLATDPRPPL